MTALARSRSRVVTRIPASVRKTLEAAAELQGSTLNQFLVQAAFRQAQEILERETLLRLNREQTRKIFELLERPARPNAALRAAKAAHRKLVRAAH